MPWWGRKSGAVTRAFDGPSFSVGDPALAEFLGIGSASEAGVRVTEATALGSSAVWRCVSILAGTIGGLPLKSYANADGPLRQEVPSFLDNPGAPWYTPFEWKSMVVAHLALHGNAYLLHVYGGGGQLVALFPVHPSLVKPRWAMDANGVQYREYTVQVNGQQVCYTDAELTHVMLLSTDGLQGMSPIWMARNAIGTGLAGDKAAARMFGNGFMLGGIVTPSDGSTLTLDQGKEILASLKAQAAGVNNAGDWAVINASLNLSPWSMNLQDAQFIESRQHQITEVARIFGIPKVLLAEDGASTWGAGIAELDAGMAKYTFKPYTDAIQDRVTWLVRGRPSLVELVEFDYAGLLQGTPEEEIGLLLEQVAGGMLTVDEARAIRNMPPVKGDGLLTIDEAKAAANLPALVSAGLLTVNEARQIMKLPPVPGGDVAEKEESPSPPATEPTDPADASGSQQEAPNGG